MGKTEDKILKDFGLRVRYLRRSKGWSQELLAEEAQIGKAYLGRVERAECSTSLRSIARIAKALDVEIGELFPSRKR